MKNKKNPETFGSRWRYVWVLFALVFSVSVAAQKTVVKGNILDKDNLPIIGANILEKGTSNGTIMMWTVTSLSRSQILRLHY